MPGVAAETGFDVVGWLGAFVRARRGLRPGMMFGAPAVYAGRRLVACAWTDGLICTLPDEVLREQFRRRRGVPVQARGREMTGWILYRPVSLAAARRLEPILETAARFVAEAPPAAQRPRAAGRAPAPRPRRPSRTR